MNHAFMYVEKKSKHTDLNNTPELMSLPINDLSYFTYHLLTYLTLHTICRKENASSLFILGLSLYATNYPHFTVPFKVLPTKIFNKMRICEVFRPFLQRSLISRILRFEILQTTKRRATKKRIWCLIFTLSQLADKWVIFLFSNIDVQNGSAVVATFV